MMTLRLYSLSGQFAIVGHIDVATIEAARPHVEKHLAGSGFTKLRTVHDEDYSVRFIADPPANGRKGRNVAAIDFACAQDF